MTKFGTSNFVSFLGALMYYRDYNPGMTSAELDRYVQAILPIRSDRWGA